AFPPKGAPRPPGGPELLSWYAAGGFRAPRQHVRQIAVFAFETDAPPPRRKPFAARPHERPSLPFFVRARRLAHHNNRRVQRPIIRHMRLGRHGQANRGRGGFLPPPQALVIRAGRTLRSRYLSCAGTRASSAPHAAHASGTPCTSPHRPSSAAASRRRCLAALRARRRAPASARRAS